MTRPQRTHRAVLNLSCPDRAGIVHAVSGVLLTHACTIVESQQFGDASADRFFMRVEFGREDGTNVDVESMRPALEKLASEFDMRWRLTGADTRPRVVIMVGRFAHCLNDLLFRISVGELDVEVVAVISNHPDPGRLADSYGVPFRQIPVTAETKADAEAELLKIVESEGVDLVVLARYMQVLSDNLCRRLAGRVINIHHSMLPSFKGARPYHQAHARGVKVIGATAHYVTADLDEGPIIEQELIRVDHTLTPDDLEAQGREAESRALARAVRWHVENRIALNGTRTVVFR